MRKYESIEAGIANNDIAALREAVGSLCYTDRDFSDGEFDEAVKYVEGRGIKLREDTLSGPPTISSQKTEFTDDDFADAVFELKENFCDERIADVKNIGRVLYGKETRQDPCNTGSNQSGKRTDNTHSSVEKRADPNLGSRSHKRVIALVVCVAAVILIIILLLVQRQ